MTPSAANANGYNAVGPVQVGFYNGQLMGLTGGVPELDMDSVMARIGWDGTVKKLVADFTPYPAKFGLDASNVYGMTQWKHKPAFVIADAGANCLYEVCVFVFVLRDLVLSKLS